MTMVCLDMEGVLRLEDWIVLAGLIPSALYAMK